MRRFPSVHCIGVVSSVCLLQPQQIVMADGCLNIREALCVRCHSNNRSNSTARSKHRNSGSFVIEEKDQRARRRNTHTL